MVDLIKRPRLVGNFIRERREALSLSQRALGLLFSPPVTTQFISNVERGVTPLPPAHVPTLTKALMVSEAELMGLLEKEYTVKLTGRLGKEGAPALAELVGTSHALPTLIINNGDFEFIRKLYDAYRQADPKTKQAFATVCESILSLPKAVSGSPTGE